MAGVAAMVVVEQVLAAEAAGRRQVVGVEKAGQRRDPGLAPAAAAQDHERPLGARRAAGAARPWPQARGRLRRDRPARPSGTVGRLDQHVLGQRQDDRPGPAGHGGGEGAMDELRDAGGVLDLGHPLRHAAEHLPVVDLLEGVALAAAAVDLADEQDHRHAVLLGDVHAGAGVGGTGAAGDHGDAGPAGELAPGGRHHRRAAFLAADDEADLGRVVQRVQDLEIALARHAEDGSTPCRRSWSTRILPPVRASPAMPLSRCRRTAA